MRTLVVGDVHGCAGELSALLDRAAPDRVVLVGDLFAKGPDPQGVWQIIQQTRAEAVLGNHDAGMLTRWDEALAGPGTTAQHKAVRALGQAQAQVRPWLQALPYFWCTPGVIVVHAGLHPTRGLAGTRRQQALTMRQFSVGHRKSFWWEHYRGEMTVVYGHDASRGLQDHRPYSLGLDTGCVYGGSLTGLLLETGELFATPAAQRWCPT